MKYLQFETYVECIHVEAHILISLLIISKRELRGNLSSVVKLAPCFLFVNRLL